VVGKREDGYHLLDSLVLFCNAGDEIILEPAKTFSFAIEGPLALELQGEHNNLVTKAAQALAKAKNRPLDFKLTLIKNLPIASGIGGGSSDAAATLRLLLKYWEYPLEDPVAFEIAKNLGQDIPCCLYRNTCYFKGIGDILDPGPTLPHINLLLVNPRLALPTAAVFKARHGDFSEPAKLEKTPETAAELADMLKTRKNDLAAPACEMLPEINAVLSAIANTKDCLLSRMSGSGATCFGIYPDRNGARNAAATIFNNHPSWWVVPASAPYIKSLS
ncbi:MAG: 4-(cytidine 5'-diphospho)-2-C-methyl-D-erythritol kinase, partial [Alphaproteobacteria bacterium]|nr:4-(cytidine 5'-diphospho)-2-C-methyl-D-erythritol kinase [Alphaproteobacteria bacterium]